MSEPKTIAPALRLILTQITEVTTLTGTRLYFARLPQEPTYPAVTIQLTDRDPNNALASLPKLVRSSVLVRSWSTSYGAAHQLAYQIHSAINGQKFIVRDHSYLRSIVAGGMRDVYESEVDAYGIEQEFRIWHYFEPTVYSLHTEDGQAQAFLDGVILGQHHYFATDDLSGQVFLDDARLALGEPLVTEDLLAQAFLDGVILTIKPTAELEFTSSFGHGALLPQPEEGIEISTTAVLDDKAMTIEDDLEVSFSTEIFDDGAP